MIILPRKLVLWILGGLIALLVIFGCKKVCHVLDDLLTAQVIKNQKVDVGLGYTPPDKPIEPKEEKNE